MMDRPKNVFQELFNALGIINGNIVDLSQELAALRADVAYIKEQLLPCSKLAEEEQEEEKASNKKK